MGIDAFVLGAQSVECLAVLALHAFTPIRDANPVTFLRRIRVGAVLGLPRWAPQPYIVGMGPLDVVVFGEATIDQIVGGFVSFSVHGLDPGLCQTAIRTAGIDVDRDVHLVFRRRYDLHVVSGAPSTIRHLHHPRVGVGGRSRGGILSADLFLVALTSPLAHRRDDVSPAPARTRKPSCANVSSDTNPASTIDATPCARSRSRTAI